MAKAMKEISSGAQKWEGEKWFAELSDKGMCQQLIVCFLKTVNNRLKCYCCFPLKHHF